jgi:adenylate kinase family enzyme
VIEWQYDQVRPLLAERADLVVWLDLPRHVVMRQVVRRTVRRRVRREVLWNGNVEAPLRTVFTDPEHIIRWAWRTHHESEQRISALLAAEPDRPVVRFRSRREADQWLAGPLTAAR